MNSSIILAYLLIVCGVAVWFALLPMRKNISAQWMQYITVFGGAFLFASCFINLVPHIFLGEGTGRFVTEGCHFKIAASVMAGFLIQLLLEQITRGVEHGHNHCECCEEEVVEHHHHQHHHHGQCHDGHAHPITGLMIGLCIHAFLEGMPMVDLDGDIHQGLLYGIVLHNIPIAIVMVSLFAANGYGWLKSLALLLLFGVMTPIGSLCNTLVLPPDEQLQRLIMGVVVGILLHVSVSILFDHDHNRFSIAKFALILAAFAAAYFTPGCPEIYPL